MPIPSRRTLPSNWPARLSPASAKSVVLSLAKGLRVLEVFDAQEPELTLSQIAARAALDAGTSFRLAKTLVMLGYLRQSEDRKRYRLGLKVLDLGFNAIGRMDLHTVARPILRSLVGPVMKAAGTMARILRLSGSTTAPGTS